VFDSQGHSSHGRWRCPEPGCGVLLGANAVQAPVTMCKSSWAAVASCFLRELRVPSLPVGSRTFYLMVQEGSHNPLHCPLAGMTS